MTPTAALRMVFLLVIATGCGSSPQEEVEETPPLMALKARIGWDGIHVIVQNGDEFVWSECEMELFSGTTLDAFQMRLGMLRPLTENRYRLVGFSTDAGVPYNPSRGVPNRVLIRCREGVYIGQS